MSFRRCVKDLIKANEEVKRLEKEVKSRDSERWSLQNEVRELKEKYIHPKLQKDIDKRLYEIDVTTEVLQSNHVDAYGSRVYNDFSTPKFTVKERILTCDVIGIRVLGGFQTEGEALEFIEAHKRNMK